MNGGGVGGKKEKTQRTTEPRDIISHGLPMC